MTFSQTRLRVAFFINAGMNISMSIVSMIFPAFHFALLYNISADNISNILLLYHQMFWSFVGIMGIGYYLMARRPREHEGIILIGGLGKIAAVLAWAHALYHYNANLILLIGIMWDGFWGVFFLAVLWQYRREGALRLM